MILSVVISVRAHKRTIFSALNFCSETFSHLNVFYSFRKLKWTLITGHGVAVLNLKLEATASTAAVTRSKKFATNWFSFVVLHEPTTQESKLNIEKRKRKRKVSKKYNYYAIGFFRATNNWICQFFSFDTSEGKIKSWSKSLITSICMFRFPFKFWRK